LIEEIKVNPECPTNGLPVICSAAMNSQHEIIKYLLSVGVNINQRTKTGENALHCVVPSKNVETLKVLISFGCDFKAKDRYNFTPLQLSKRILGRNLMIVEFLEQTERKYWFLILFCFPCFCFVCLGCLFVIFFFFQIIRFPRMKTCLRFCRIIGCCGTLQNSAKIIFKSMIRVRKKKKKKRTQYSF
jgi:hypothetical protein